MSEEELKQNGLEEGDPSLLAGSDTPYIDTIYKQLPIVVQTIPSANNTSALRAIIWDVGSSQQNEFLGWYGSANTWGDMFNFTNVNYSTSSMDIDFTENGNLGRTASLVNFSVDEGDEIRIYKMDSTSNRTPETIEDGDTTLTLVGYLMYSENNLPTGTYGNDNISKNSWSSSGGICRLIETDGSITDFRATDDTGLYTRARACISPLYYPGEVTPEPEPEPEPEPSTEITFTAVVPMLVEDVPDSRNTNFNYSVRSEDDFWYKLGYEEEPEPETTRYDFATGTISFTFSEVDEQRMLNGAVSLVFQCANNYTIDYNQEDVELNLGSRANVSVNPDYLEVEGDLIINELEFVFDSYGTIVEGANIEVYITFNSTAGSNQTVSGVLNLNDGRDSGSLTISNLSVALSTEANFYPSIELRIIKV